MRLHGGLDETGDTSHWGAYGSDGRDVHALMGERAEWSEPLHPSLPYRAGEVIWAARRELARTVEDVLARRTRALLLDARASAECAPVVACLLAKELGRDDRWIKEQVSAFQTLADSYLPRGWTP